MRPWLCSGDLREEAVVPPERIQLQLVLPYKFQPGSHREVRSRLAEGFVIEGVQRLTDREAVITLVRPDPPAPDGPSPT